MKVAPAPLRLPLPVACAGVSAEARQALRQLLGDVERDLAGRFHTGESVELLVQARAVAVEQVLAHVWCAWVGNKAQATLFAVGGFGRLALFPHSDVDVLVLVGIAPSSLLRGVEAFFACLWDIGLKPGHAVRSVAQCVELAGNDVSVMTNLLERRRIAGNSALEVMLQRALASPSLWPAHKYFLSKCADWTQRSERYSNTAYNLEPNIKEGPGGLRNLQLLGWLGQQLFAAPTLQALVQVGMLVNDEAERLATARTYLWRCRYALHLLAKHGEERLLFDYQRELARQLGYEDEHAENLAVEQCMQDFFRAAICVKRITEQFLQRCEEQFDTDPKSQQVRRLTLDFISIGGRLDSDTPELFLQRPSALIDLFRVWIEHPELIGLRADLTRRIQQALVEIGAQLADDKLVNAAFARLLRKGVPAVEALSRMNCYGVLALYLPAFGRVVGRMQYDLFHVYTVDEHTLRVLRFIAHFATSAGKREFALAHEVYARLLKPEVLLLAALFHDIAKGGGGNHSELGEQVAHVFCIQLGLFKAEVEEVAWLVRWHLLMSSTAQRQDITDPDVVHAFAVAVADSERLDHLYLLTVADICGTSPKLWNLWKAKLLADLYTSARYVLRRGLERPPHADERIAACQREALDMLAEQGIAADAAKRLWADWPAQSFLRYRPAQIAWQTAALARTIAVDLPLVLIEPDSAHGGTEIFVCSPDRDGLFATLTAVLDRLHLNVHAARVANSRGGLALDSFLVLDRHGKALSTDMAATTLNTLRRALVKPLPEVQIVRRTPARSLRHFHVPTHIEFAQQPTSARTQVALVCSDRPGLLAAVAQAFRECGVRVHEARIATFGERAEDFFEITDEDNQAILQAETLEALRNALLRCLTAQINDTPWLARHEGQHAGT